MGLGAATPERECVACYPGDSFSWTRLDSTVISTVTFMTHAHQCVCASCAERGMFGKPNPTFRAVRTHICKSPVCKTASLGVKQVELETRPTDAMVGAGAAGQAPDLRYQPPGR